MGIADLKLPLVNLEEEPGKVVGANTTGAADYDRLVAAAEGIMPRLPFPKGVYRFRSFEEANAWTEQHILRAARKVEEAPGSKQQSAPGLLNALRRWFS